MRDTIDMAREAGIIHPEMVSNNLKAFEALVRADERDRAMRENAYVQAEREACAKVCEEIYTGEEACGDWPTPEMCATAIRARGNT
jgi:hypothetical protein